MGRNSMQAGKRFERRIATDLRAWLGDKWVVARNQTDRQKGQIEGCAGEFTIEGPQTFPFCIECKDGSGFDPRQLFKYPVPGPLASTSRQEGFWAQAVRQAETVDLKPLLICRRAGRGSILACSYTRVFRFGLFSTTTRIQVEGYDLQVVRWEDLLAFQSYVVIASQGKWKTMPPKRTDG